MWRAPQAFDPSGLLIKEIRQHHLRVKTFGESRGSGARHRWHQPSPVPVDGAPLKSLFLTKMIELGANCMVICHFVARLIEGKKHGLIDDGEGAVDPKRDAFGRF